MISAEEWCSLEDLAYEDHLKQLRVAIEALGGGEAEPSEDECSCGLSTTEAQTPACVALGKIRATLGDLIETEEHPEDYDADA